MKDNILAT